MVLPKMKVAMRTVVFLVVSTLLCSLVGCRTLNSERVTWRKSDVTGLKMSLDDPTREEWYQFNGDGSVSVTYGTKGGWIASPLLFWRIKRGVLQIRKENQSVFQELSLIRITENCVTAKNKDAQTVNYKIIH